MPPPTVSCVPSSTRMNEPVFWLRRVLVDEQRQRRTELHPADVVQCEPRAVLVARQRVDVEAVEQVSHLRTRPAGGVLDRVDLVALERTVGVEPADLGRDVLRHHGLVVRAAEHVAAADVDLVAQPDRDRAGRERLVDGLAETVDALDRGGEARRQHHDLVAGTEDAAGDDAGVAAVVVVVVTHRTDHELHREARVDEVAVGADVHVLEVVEQRRSVVPRRVVGLARDVVAEQRRHRDEREVVDVELGGEVGEVGADRVEAALVVVDEVHLVDAEHEVLHLQQRRDHRMATALLDHAVARVDEDEREVSRRRAGDHVARCTGCDPACRR